MYIHSCAKLVHTYHSHYIAVHHYRQETNHRAYLLTTKSIYMYTVIVDSLSKLQILLVECQLKHYMYRG